MRHRFVEFSLSFSEDDEYVSSYLGIITFFFRSPLLKYFLRRGHSDLIWPGLLHLKHLTYLEVSHCWKSLLEKFLLGPFLLFCNSWTLLIRKVCSSSSSSEDLSSLFSTSETTIVFSALELCFVLVFWETLRAIAFPLLYLILKLLFMNLQWANKSITNLFKFLASIMAMTFSLQILGKLQKIFLILRLVVYSSYREFNSFTIVVNLVSISSMDSCSFILSISNLWVKILT